MKLWYLKLFICRDSLDEECAFDGLSEIGICSFISYLSLQLKEFLQSEIKHKWSSVQKLNYNCITAIADKKIISSFCVSRVLCSPTHSAVQIK